MMGPKPRELTRRERFPTCVRERGEAGSLNAGSVTIVGHDADLTPM
jgi:hypothetical protein